MNALSDQQLLHADADRHADAAFAELVRRHVDIVYSAARRMIGEEQSARDTTQAVFLALAQNAASLAQHPVLSGWLHCTARNLAAKSVRAEVRRRACEQEAATMNQLLSAESEVPWEFIAPHLDAALGELSDSERDAVMLRYFENKSAPEMAGILGISSEAAQKRVGRGVERLRDYFANHGLTIGGSGLIVLISTNAVQAAPVGLATAISAAVAVAGTTLATAATATAAKAIAMTTLQKTLVTATIIALAGGGIYKARQATQLRERIQSLQQQQAPLNEQIQALRGQRDEATQQLAALQASQPRDLLRLRNEVGLLRQQTNALAQQLSEIRHGIEANARQSNAAVKPIPCDSCIFSGYATPEAALQTYVWALNTHNVQAYLDCFTPAAREEAAKEFEGKSEPEIMGMLIGKLHGAAALRLDRKETQEDGAVSFPLRSFEDNNGLTISKTTAMIRFRNVAGECRLVAE